MNGKEGDSIFIKRGIALKTFVFTTALITAALFVSFGVLYVTLPDYYFYIKNKSLHTNAELLAAEIDKFGSIEDIQRAINNFTYENNATVILYPHQEAPIVGVSIPFSIMYATPYDISQEDQRAIMFRGKLQGDEKLIDEELDAKNNDETNFYTISVTEQAEGLIRGVQSRNIIFPISRRLTGMSMINIDIDLQSELVDRIEVISTLQPIDEAKNVIISLSPYLLILNIIFAIIISYLYSQHMSKPIVALSAAAARMQSMTPGVVSGIRTNNEIGELSENLDLLYLNLCSNIDNLRLEMEKASILEKSKADFMRAASHELKTPLAALNCIIEGMIDNMGRYKDKDKYLRESKKLVNNLSKLTAEILKASKLEVADNELHMEIVSLPEMIEAVLDTQRLFIEEKRLDINLVMAQNPVLIETDANILRNVLSNIISNAVKYTDNGEKVIITVVGSKEVSVENQCENVPDDRLSKLFEPFYTLDYSRNRIKSGTGLGLYIVKNNLESLGLGYKLQNTELGLKFSIYLSSD